jgi:hypothetical protein
MKKLVIGFLSVLVLIASLLGGSPKRLRPSSRAGRDSGPAMWI